MVLEGEQDSLDFIAWLLSAPQALKSVRCLIIDRVCEVRLVLASSLPALLLLVDLDFLFSFSCMTMRPTPRS